MGETMKPRVQVLIVDDRPISRNGLRALLGTLPDITIVGEAADGQEAVRLVEELEPDVVLMDVCMPVLDGLAATRIIKKRWPAVKVVVLTMYALPEHDVMAAGADAFLIKGCPSRELFGAIQCARGSERIPTAPSGRTQGDVPSAKGVDYRQNRLLTAALTS
jgi:DNA-binding NarL/FixJ family response regulator